MTQNTAPLCLMSLMDSNTPSYDPVSTERFIALLEGKTELKDMVFARVLEALLAKTGGTLPGQHHAKVTNEDLGALVRIAERGLKVWELSNPMALGRSTVNAAVVTLENKPFAMLRSRLTLDPSFHTKPYDYTVVSVLDAEVAAKVVSMVLRGRVELQEFVMKMQLKDAVKPLSFPGLFGDDSVCAFLTDSVFTIRNAFDVPDIEEAFKRGPAFYVEPDGSNYFVESFDTWMLEPVEAGEKPDTPTRAVVRCTDGVLRHVAVRNLMFHLDGKFTEAEQQELVNRVKQPTAWKAKDCDPQGGLITFVQHFQGEAKTEEATLYLAGGKEETEAAWAKVKDLGASGVLTDAMLNGMVADSASFFIDDVEHVAQLLGLLPVEA